MKTGLTNVAPVLIQLLNTNNKNNTTILKMMRMRCITMVDTVLLRVAQDEATTIFEQTRVRSMVRSTPLPPLLRSIVSTLQSGNKSSNKNNNNGKLCMSYPAPEHPIIQSLKTRMTS